MKKFILDTNVLINDPRAFLRFGENEVVIPIIVISELDGLKKRNDSTGTSARQVARELDELRDYGHLHTGITLPSGGTLRVCRQTPKPSFEIPNSTSINDHIILQNCIDENAILITEDSFMRIEAEALGIEVERYRNSLVKNKNIYDEARCLEVDATSIDLLHKHPDTAFVLENNQFEPEINEYMYSHGILLRYLGDEEYIKVAKGEVYKFSAKNKEQSFLIDALLDPGVTLVVAAGKAGTGKSFLAVACGLHEVLEQSTYKQLLISRPIVSMKNELGFLPGSMQEKLNPWMAPLYDAIELVIPSSHGRALKSHETLQEVGKLKIESLEHIRGRSIPKSYIIIDEAQNLSEHEMKTIITRCGEGTKIVLTGDPEQIDSPYLDQYNNGLTHVINKFKGNDCFAYVSLHKGERSHLAELAAELM